jgi:hypothetical protein
MAVLPSTHLSESFCRALPESLPLARSGLPWSQRRANCGKIAQPVGYPTIGNVDAERHDLIKFSRPRLTDLSQGAGLPASAPYPVAGVDAMGVFWEMEPVIDVISPCMARSSASREVGVINFCVQAACARGKVPYIIGGAGPSIYVSAQVALRRASACWDTSSRADRQPRDHLYVSYFGADAIEALARSQHGVFIGWRTGASAEIPLSVVDMSASKVTPDLLTLADTLAR